MILPKNIRYLRKSRGLTYGDLEKELGCSKGSIKEYESGNSVPELTEMAAMAQFFRVALDDLMFRDISKRGRSDLPQQNGADISGKDMHSLLAQTKQRIEQLKKKIKDR
ncbi:helix-turn-helix transcriptional regulator [Flavilitoribacter nigricans]|uniref:HTH cro/C1-type domain-containing protein n=1 Tax=Flavilitoribacter nigricans (strain ATCC 23147 / DSM 23189 / NBRC 102662 / NCIMB 1420 / SS-2) TaxID=1122177 RepID=A0A2D0NAY7_FLAN2|nr:helix-turn-helix transcriptional regulator [Flavilitoribacter nigricans]PHN05655.1 hypothetical protein CRP01_14320 [Flavilitoribacter nigricans DSM 23189 = NBRC 102662]